MTRIADGSVSIQISSEAVPATPSWFGEVAAFAQVLTHEGILRMGSGCSSSPTSPTGKDENEDINIIMALRI